MFQECRHIKTDGLRCHGPALSGKAYCYFHMNLRRTHALNYTESRLAPLPPIEDTSSVLIALGQVLRALDDPFADFRRAGLKLQALQIAAKLTTQREKSRPEQLVRTLYDPSGETIDFTHAADNGIEMLAPSKSICEPPADCCNCPKQNTCDNYEEPEEDEEDFDEEEYDPEENNEEEDPEDKADDHDLPTDTENKQPSSRPSPSDPPSTGSSATGICHRGVTGVEKPAPKPCHSDRPTGVEEPAVAFNRS